MVNFSRDRYENYINKWNGNPRNLKHSNRENAYDRIISRIDTGKKRTGKWEYISTEITQIETEK